MALLNRDRTGFFDASGTIPEGFTVDATAFRTIVIELGRAVD